MHQPIPVHELEQQGNEIIALAIIALAKDDFKNLVELAKSDDESLLIL